VALTLHAKEQEFSTAVVEEVTKQQVLARMEVSVSYVLLAACYALVKIL
jgi:hypothetical protein